MFTTCVVNESITSTYSVSPPLHILPHLAWSNDPTLNEILIGSGCSFSTAKSYGKLAQTSIRSVMYLRRGI